MVVLDFHEEPDENSLKQIRGQIEELERRVEELENAKKPRSIFTDSMRILKTAKGGLKNASISKGLVPGTI